MGIAYIGGKRESWRLLGEVLGMSASLCVRHATTPRGVYDDYLSELQ